MANYSELKGLNVLLVDDSTFALNQLSSILKTYSCKTFLAENAKDALKQYKDNQIDIVVTDYNMPGKNGLDLAKILINEDPNAKIILISALDDKKILIEAIAVGIKQYIAKPLDVNQLLNVLRSQAYSAYLEKQIAGKLEQFDVITGASSEMIIIVDYSGSIKFANNEFYKNAVTGVNDNNLNIYNYLSSGEADEFKKILKDEMIINTSSRFRISSSAKFRGKSFECSVGVWKDEGSEQYVLIFRDISAELENSKNSQMFINIFENSIEGIVITDAENKIIACNPVFEDITGYRLNEIIGQTPNILKSGRHDAEFYEKMWDDINNKGVWNGKLFNRKKNGEIYYELLSIFSIKDESGEVINYVGLFTDLFQKSEDDTINRLAYYDVLTNLPNRQYFQEYLRRTITKSLRHESSLAVIYFDIDDFKKANDFYGHHIGDTLLCEVAGRLKNSLPDVDTFARLGGDEFAIIISDEETGDDIHNAARRVSERILKEFERPFSCVAKDIYASASLGVSFFPKDSKNSTELLKFADVAMYESKKDGKGRYTFYNEEINTKVTRFLEIENQLQKADKDKEFELYLQPQIDTNTEKIIGSEALLRWKNPELGFVSPADFIPVAEDSGLIFEIDQWVLKKVPEYVRKLRESGYYLPVSVNLSAKSLETISNIQIINSIIQESYTEGGIVLEITEGALVRNIGYLSILTEAANSRGIFISIDDFGTGYSSLSYLKTIKANSLKIDKAFINDITFDINDKTIVEAIIRMAHTMGIKVVAEGVETAEQVSILKEYGCNSIQGYYYSRPLVFKDFIEFVKKG